jgi:hypothetical protein
MDSQMDSIIEMSLFLLYDKINLSFVSWLSYLVFIIVYHVFKQAVWYNGALFFWFLLFGNINDQSLTQWNVVKLISPVLLTALKYNV